jgi:hypothetical protein
MPRYIRSRSVNSGQTTRHEAERSWVVFDPGYAFRRAFSWLPTQLASQSDTPVGPRQFGSTEHLSIEALAAFVDGELRMAAHLRAAHHLSLCPECAHEVDAQRQAREALRECRPVAMPSSLLGLLSQIPHHTPVEADEPAESPQLADGTQRARRKRR